MVTDTLFQPSKTSVFICQLASTLVAEVSDMEGKIPSPLHQT